MRSQLRVNGTDEIVVVSETSVYTLDESLKVTSVVLQDVRIAAAEFSRDKRVLFVVLGNSAGVKVFAWGGR